jgi:hypothetical protein
MREAIANPLAYYASQSYITDPQAYARMVNLTAEEEFA